MKNMPKETLAMLLKGWEWSERQHEIPFLFNHLPEPPSKILDVGCCYSAVLTVLDELGYDAWGIDMQKYHKPYDKFKVADARKTPFNDNEFDVTCSISVIEHAGLVPTPYHTDTVEDSDADIKIFNEMVRITKPDGKIIITIPYGLGNTNLYHWVRFYDKQRVNRFLSNKQFVLDEIEYAYCTDKTDGGGDATAWHICDEQIASIQKSLPSKVMANVCFVGHKKL